MFSKAILNEISQDSSHHNAYYDWPSGTLWHHLIIPKTFSRYFPVKNRALNPLVHVFAIQRQPDTPCKFKPLCNTMDDTRQPLAPLIIPKTLSDIILLKIMLWINLFVFASHPKVIHHVKSHHCASLWHPLAYILMPRVFQPCHHKNNFINWKWPLCLFEQWKLAKETFLGNSQSVALNG